MPRPPRVGETGGLYHALNRGNLRATSFHKEMDFAAFERILYDALQIHKVELFSFQLMPATGPGQKRVREPEDLRLWLERIGKLGKRAACRCKKQRIRIVSRFPNFVAVRVQWRGAL
jgi:hypothetical protein